MHRILAAALAAASLLLCQHVGAAAQRTFVSTAGNDANTAANCSLAAPCRSFGSALTVTAADGEIVALDSGGYGRVTIDKSVSIVAPTGIFAGVSVFAGTNGIDVNGVNIVVVLRGLTINGQGGDKGIAFAQGSRLYVEGCTISNMANRAVELAAGETYVTDTAIRDNESFGIWAEGSISVTIDRTRIERNGYTGLRVLNGPRLTMTHSVVAGNYGYGGFDVDTDDGGSETVVTVTDSTISQNAAQGFSVAAANAGSIVRLAIARCTISRNGFTGVVLSAATGTLTAVVTDNTIVRNSFSGGLLASGAGVSATIANNAVSGNGTYGVAQASGALLKTRSNNVVQDNTTDTSGTLTFVAGD